MTHTAGEAQYGGRLRIATDIELGSALREVDKKVSALHDDIAGQLDAVLKTLVPDTFLFVISVPRGTTVMRAIGTGGRSTIQKITLVKIAPGAFPSSVTCYHDDIPGVFVLDSAQTNVSVGLIVNGERNMSVTNNDAAVDCAVWVTHEIEA